MATMSGWRITRAGGIFIVVTLLLTGILIGGIYFVSQRGEQVRQQEAAEIARQNLEESSDGPAVIAREEPEAEEPVNSGQAEVPAGSSDEEVVPSELPETGPTSASVLAAAVLTFFIAAYGVSRRALQRVVIRG